MEEDIKKYFEGIKKHHLIKQHRKNRFVYLTKLYIKYFLYVVLFLFIVSSIFFPTFTATIIANWIVNYFGTFITILIS